MANGGNMATVVCKCNFCDENFDSECKVDLCPPCAEEIEHRRQEEILQNEWEAYCLSRVAPFDGD